MYLQGFSQEGVQLSYECPFLEELRGKIHLISYNFIGKHSSGQPVFNVWLKACKASDERSAKNLTFLQKNLDIISIKLNKFVASIRTEILACKQRKKVLKENAA